MIYISYVKIMIKFFSDMFLCYKSAMLPKSTAKFQYVMVPNQH